MIVNSETAQAGGGGKLDRSTLFFKFGDVIFKYAAFNSLLIVHEVSG